ncbi:hypothetical protein M0R45_030719 [Rubus argutus]|uniref:Uncharacterized protein n=1 Tax=Rubus argutus TaxID=59490 RepID=A0AAW1WC69_RUBAR
MASPKPAPATVATSVTAGPLPIRACARNEVAPPAAPAPSLIQTTPPIPSRSAGLVSHLEPMLDLHIH